MHGVARGTRVFTEEEIAKKKVTADKWKENYDKVMEYKKNGEELVNEVWKLTEGLVLMNPDCYSLWNYRKNIILSKFNVPTKPVYTPSEDPLQIKQQQRCKQCNRKISLNSSEYHISQLISTPQSLLCRVCYTTRVSKPADLLNKELLLVQESIRTSPKSYGIWYHREWLLSLFVDTPRLARAVQVSWSDELSLCNQFLRYDSRNFHCWNYRRFVIKRGAIDIDSELSFTEQKIGEGGSFFGFNRAETSIKQNSLANYSAWHQRSALLVKKIKGSEEGVVQELLQNDFVLLSNALLMHDGQSPWLYLRWLMVQVPETQRVERATEMMEICDEILKVDREGIAEGEKAPETSKWAMLTKVFLLRIANTGDAISDAKNILEELKVCDMDRAGFYNSLKTGEAKIH